MRRAARARGGDLHPQPLTPTAPVQEDGRSGLPVSARPRPKARSFKAPQGCSVKHR